VETINVTAAPLMGEKKYAEAIAYLSDYARQHPQSTQLWRVYALLGDAYAGKGDSAKARASYDKAMAAAHDVSERTEVQDSINTVKAEGKYS
jgi:predicted Zn-dependent protease